MAPPGGVPSKRKQLRLTHKLTPHQQEEAKQRREAGETIMAIAKSYAVHHSTISRLWGECEWRQPSLIGL
jgi:DNA invertase Pin-like site-specific DNA recombinase